MKMKLDEYKNEKDNKKKKKKKKKRRKNPPSKQAEMTNTIGKE